MSMPVRHLQAEPPAALAGPVLVPVMGDPAPRMEVQPAKPPPVNAHRVFYGMWYAALVMFAAEPWIGRIHDAVSLLFGVLGGVFVALGGLGILIHTLCRPSEQRLRHTMAAGAALVLTLAAREPLRDANAQVYATARVARLQPLAEALARDGHIRNVGITGSQLRLNGFYGDVYTDQGWLEQTGDPAITLTEVLQRDGITRAELRRYVDGLRGVGMGYARRTDATVLFTPAGTYDMKLLYVVPGQPVPDPTTWRSEPLGGDWYLLLLR
jgi:hypothetical protein